ncbi:MAG: response regulator [Candidatus Nitrohelix vancouverensis]|uniref:Response regulator n=1 Tax=Candidatus Nitrohelix vancouverensis TaxID=2705534 RepID=A0A7T0C3Y6_9BACT|nr:MAG: response regulator [Candidatus Nitrohelix vancouverensis]
MGIKIAVVDDDETVLEMMRFHFKNSSDVDKVECTQDSQHAILLIHDYKPDVILLDIKMPGLAGDLFLSSLRAWIPKTPIIMVSGVTDKAVQRNCLELGAVAFLEKPVDLDALDDTIHEAAGRLSANSPHPVLEDSMELEMVLKILVNEGRLTTKEAQLELKRRMQEGGN